MKVNLEKEGWPKLEWINIQQQKSLRFTGSTTVNRKAFQAPNINWKLLSHSWLMDVSSQVELLILRVVQIAILPFKSNLFEMIWRFKYNQINLIWFDLTVFFTNSNNLNHLYSCSNYTFATQIKSNQINNRWFDSSN